MIIVNLDRDRKYNIESVFYKGHKSQETFMGWNIYGINKLGRKYLLGTYDTQQEAKQIVEEIQRLQKKNIVIYYMPELVDDLEVECIIDGLLKGG